MTPTNYYTCLGGWPKSIIFPSEYDGSESLRLSWDLGRVDELEKKKVIKEWIMKLPTLQHLKRLSLWTHVTQPLFDAACELRQLEVLEIKLSNARNLEAITRLQNLHALTIGSSTRVKSIEPLATLQSLKVLEIENFKAISDFAPLTKLTGLEDLAVTGSMWARQAIASLEPFAAMTWLSSLVVDTSGITSLRPLGRLKGLRKLGVGGRLPFEEYAWLSSKLPNTECQWFAPYIDMSAKGYSACKSCKQDSMVMLSGKGKPVLCKHCDSAKVEKHVVLFNATRAAALSDS